MFLVEDSHENILLALGGSVTLVKAVVEKVWSPNLWSMFGCSRGSAEWQVRVFVRTKVFDDESCFHEHVLPAASYYDACYIVWQANVASYALDEPADKPEEPAASSEDATEAPDGTETADATEAPETAEDATEAPDATEDAAEDATEDAPEDATDDESEDSDDSSDEELTLPTPSAFDSAKAPTTG